ncbi:unannotated protein [freshwater metagenome]|uniref:Unannotated protein n=1 Tax=freshwater metagenome TaxID=449393 RepID=A0A6J7JLT9_9ZZZZ|nr:DUF3850 domain-containing protein [Actinomycetota bacterium]
MNDSKTIHSLKSWPNFFGPIVAGDRRHELRRNDRGFRIGDEILLNEFDPALVAYTGRTCLVTITSITSSEFPCAVSDVGLNPDFCILTISLVSQDDRTDRQFLSSLAAH